MEITSQNSPLTDEQASQLNDLLKGLEGHQIDWLSGYMAGWRAAQTGQPAAAAAAPAAAADAPSLTVLYGSQTGNAEGVAEMLGERASARGINAKVVDMADYKPRQLKNETFVGVLASTHGEGDPPDNALDFHEFLYGRKAPGLKGVHFGVLALGDTSYEHFCQTGKDFDARFEELGATRLTERVDCDVDYDDPAEAWIESILVSIEEKTGSTGQAAATAPATGSAATRSKYDRKNPFPAPVLENLVLNGRGSNKETRHLELSLEESGLSYQPGDAVGIYPQNNPQLAAAVIDKLALDPDERVSLGETETTLSEALQHYREITVLTRPLMEQWALYSGDSGLRRMVEDQSALIEWMRGRDLLDVIEAWPVEGLGADTLTGMLRKLPPRLYSIASSQATVDEEVHITVAAVRYESHGREREGVASTWLSDRLEEDASVPVYIDPNKNFKLPDDDDAPIIMIGPGTGVAPFRAFMQEREERAANGRNWLFFGEQQFRADFLYQAEWLNWRRQGLLDHITLAFSRDQEDKVYVQHRIREHANEIWGWLQEGAYIYVCGDADAMAPDVNEALIDVIAEEGSKSREEATEYLRDLAREKRYQRDVY